MRSHLDKQISEYFKSRQFREMRFRSIVSWSITTDENYERLFIPHIVKKMGGAQVLGSVAVSIHAYEVYWERLINEYGVYFSEQYAPLISAFITNHPDLRRPPVIQYEFEEQDDQLNPWLSKVATLVLALPQDLEGLVSDLQRGAFGPFPAPPSRGHWLKWAAFCTWLRERSYDLPFHVDDLPGKLANSPTPLVNLFESLKQQ